MNMLQKIDIEELYSICEEMVRIYFVYIFQKSSTELKYSLNKSYKLFQ
jgi:hypothetical protein